MTVYMHKDCHEAAVEQPDVESPEVPTDFPFTCLSCLFEITDPSELYTLEVMNQ